MLEQTSLLAAVATGLLSAINDVVNDGDFKQMENPHVLNFLYVASFGAIILNASATVTSLFLIDELGDLPTLASDLDKPKEGSLASDTDILVYYGLGNTWTWTRWHCKCSMKYEYKCNNDLLFIRDHLTGSGGVVPVSASHHFRLHYANNAGKSDDDLSDYFCSPAYVQTSAQPLQEKGYWSKALIRVVTHISHVCYSHIIFLSCKDRT